MGGFRALVKKAPSRTCTHTVHTVYTFAACNCNGTDAIISESRFITSPGFPYQQYCDDLDCTYKFQCLASSNTDAVGTVNVGWMTIL
jgi:hypothetical protein